MVDVILVSGGDSNQASNCVSSSGICHNTSPSTIRHWLVSLSKVTAIYVLLVVRLGTKCDGKRLRKKVKSTRQKAVSLMQLIQASLLPHINQESFQNNAKTPLNTEYMNLFMFHCVCIEYFIEQLLRTLDLIVSFRLSYEVHAKWPIQSRNPLVYSGFTLWNYKKQYEQAHISTKTKFQTALTDHKLINKLKPSYVTSSMSENSQTSSENEENKSQGKSVKEKSTAKTQEGRSKEPSHSYTSAKTGGKNSMTSQQEYDDLIDLQKDIQVIKNLILEVYSKVQINPWAVKPMRRKKKSTRGSSNSTRSRNDKHLTDSLEYKSGNELSLTSSRKRTEMWEEEEEEDDDDEIAFSDEESEVAFASRSGNKISTQTSSTIKASNGSLTGPEASSKLKTASAKDMHEQKGFSFSQDSFKIQAIAMLSDDLEGRTKKTKQTASLNPNQIGYISILNYRRQRVVRRRCICICIISSFFILLLVLAITLWFFIYTNIEHKTTPTNGRTTA